MGVADTYWLMCDEPANHDAALCPEFEFGKVRSSALIRKRYLPAVLGNPTLMAVWQTGIQEKNIVVLPFVSGSFDPGEPVPLKGYGRRLATRGPRTMTLTFTDPAYVLNYAFYNGIHRRTDYVMAFRTSSVLHIATNPADLFARNMVDEDLQAIVAWEVKAQWRENNLPVPVPAQELSPLFHAAAPPNVTIVFASGHYVSLRATLVKRFQVGAPGSPMNEGDTVFSHPVLAGRKVLVLVDGLGLPVDDGTGEIDWSSSLVRHIEKTDDSDSLTYVGGVTNKEIHEIYALV